MPHSKHQQKLSHIQTMQLLCNNPTKSVPFKQNYLSKPRPRQSPKQWNSQITA